MRIAVIGTGLIGGSIALAARRHDDEVCGWDPDPAALTLAHDGGALTRAAGSLAEAVTDAEIVFIAAPVSTLPDRVAETLAAAPPECAVTDVGSTKRLLARFHADQRFVGGHPLAGAETAGFAQARSDLFEGATWYLTPATSTSGVLYERLHRFLSAIGARPQAIDADAHDRMLAVVSHLPHVLANVLVAEASSAPGGQLPATGPSFRDATRVAGSNSAIWTDIYLANADALTEAIDATISRLSAIRELLERRDATALTGWNEAAAGARRVLLESQIDSGPLHELRVAVPNRPGVVAELALELGRAGVNIADMALYPAADMSEGVVALWIAGDEQADRAERLIADRELPVFRA